ncbi:MAG: hypothetical protein N0E48_26235 [Candidatus Thiodiazotropha endolucinida]|nr:hypothetical protein [Candidatus Thiodiazotropha taylori]MCW4346826.1 hypothetical protein [Candidatus Thiodiazotropha endolucinida]
MAKEYLLVPKRKYESMVKSITEMEKARDNKDLPHQDAGEDVSQIQSVQRDFKDSPHQEGGKDASQSQSVNINHLKDTREDGRAGSEIKPIEIKSDNLNQPKPLPRLYVKRPLSKMDFYQGDKLKPKRKLKRTNEKTMWINYTI